MALVISCHFRLSILGENSRHQRGRQVVLLEELLA